jgi:hypothetical protein
MVVAEDSPPQSNQASSLTYATIHITLPLPAVALIPFKMQEYS